MPQLLANVRPNASYFLNNIGTFPLREREPLARAAMEAIASWSTVESWMLNLYLEFAGGNRTVAAEIFLALDTEGSKRRVISLLVRKLHPRYQELYSAISDLIKSRSKARNKLAHWVWGVSPQLMDALLLADPKALAEMEVAAPHYAEFMAQNIYIYRMSDFDSIRRDNEQLASFGFDFRWIVQGHTANFEDKLFNKLCSEPVIAEILDRRRANGRAAAVDDA